MYYKLYSFKLISIVINHLHYRKVIIQSGDHLLCIQPYYCSYNSQSLISKLKDVDALIIAIQNNGITSYLDL